MAALALAAGAGCDRPASAWVTALHDPDPFSRRLAAVALGQGAAGPAETWVPALCEVLVADRDPGVRAAAAEALAARSDESAPLVVASLAGRAEWIGPTDATRREGLAGMSLLIASMGADLLDPLVAAIERPDPDTSPARLEALTSTVGALDRSPPVVAALARLASHPEVGVRRHALAALAAGGVVPEDVVATVAAALDDPDAYVRRQAVLALAVAAPASDAALAALGRARSDERGIVFDPARRGWVAALLHRAAAGGATAGPARATLDGAGPEAVRVAIERLHGGDADAIAWLSTRGREVVAPILDAFSERAPSWFAWAADVFDAIGRPALDALRRELAAGAGLRAAKAALALGSWGPAARDAAPELAAALGAEDYQVRLAAVWACGGVGLHDPSVLEALTRLRVTGDEVTAVAASNAIVFGLAQGVADGDLTPDAAWARLDGLGDAARAALRKLTAVADDDSVPPTSAVAREARAARAAAAARLLAADPRRP